MVVQRWRPTRELTQWNPLRELEELERPFEHILGRHFFPALWSRLPVREREWVPAIDVLDKDDRLVVKAELPGIKEEDIDVSVEGDTLTIKGERKVESETKEEEYYYCERSYGSFFRSMTLPSQVQADQIEANYEDGVLEIILPKLPEVKPKKVKVATKKKGEATE